MTFLREPRAWAKGIFKVFFFFFYYYTYIFHPSNDIKCKLRETISPRGPGGGDVSGIGKINTGARRTINGDGVRRVYSGEMEREGRTGRSKETKTGRREKFSAKGAEGG